ncbi:MAG TPA: hypothetical protein VIV60_01005, partial [Polyangiaceae bacterium]
MKEVPPESPIEPAAREAHTTPHVEEIPSVLPEDIFPRSATIALRPAASAVARRARSSSVARAAGVLRRGALVDKYQIEEVLGVGGFAVVYRATHLLLRTSVALKLLRQDVLARQPAMRAFLLDEARLAVRV